MTRYWIVKPDLCETGNCQGPIQKKRKKPKSSYLKHKQPQPPEFAYMKGLLKVHLNHEKVEHAKREDKENNQLLR